MKVLIVDDEFIVRAGLISCIDWEQLGLELIGEAANGQEALNIILKETPDIILLDLLMPEMTGMELIQKLQTLKIHTNIIILSCHEDYNYVREAFKMGVKDYILKLSSTPEEICNVLKDVISKIANESLTLPMSFLEVSAHDSAVNLFPLDYNYVSISFYGEFLSSHNGQELFMQLLLQWIEKPSAFETIRIPCKMNGTTPILLYSCSKADSHCKVNDYIMNELSCMHHFLSAFITSPIYIGMSSISPLEKPIGKAYHESEKSLDTLFYTPSSTIGSYLNLEKMYDSDSTKNTASHQFQEYYFNLQNLPFLSEELEKYFQWIEKYQPDPRNLKLDCINLINHLNNLLKEKTLSFADINEEYLYYYKDIASFHFFEDLKEYIREFINLYITLLQVKSTKPLRNDIRDALQYIEDHYNEPISLNDVALHINISKNHLSFLFKKETGKTFSDYLIHYRINEAKKLLKHNSNYSLSEIAEMTGFHDTSYFSKVFKKITQISPNQYKKGI